MPFERSPDLHGHRPGTPHYLTLILFLIILFTGPGAFSQAKDSLGIITQIKTSMAVAVKPDAKQGDLAKANAAISEALETSRKNKFINGESQAYICLIYVLKRLGNGQQLNAVTPQALSFFRSHPYPTQEIDAQLETGNYYNPQIFDGLDVKIAFYETVITLMQRTDPRSLKLAHALRNLGNLHMYVRKDEPKAVEELKEALSIYQAHGKKDLQDIYGLLAGLLSDLEQFKEALRFGLLAVNSVERSGDTSPTALAAYDNLGTLYYGINDYVHGAYYLNQGLSLAKRTKNISFIFDITHDLSSTYFRLRQPVKAIPHLRYALKHTPGVDTARLCLITADLLSAYTESGQLDLAAHHVEPLLKFITSIRDDDNPAKDHGRRLLINYFLARKEYSRIPALLNNSREYALKRKQIKLLSVIEQYAFKVDSANGNYVSAIDHYQKFKVLNDSVSKRNQDKQLATLEVEYETEKKNQAIGSLTRETRLQKSALKSQVYARNMLFLGIILLILLLGLGYNRYKIKQKANFELAEQKEEIDTQNDALKQLLTEREWLLKEVHHRVKNNLQIVISLLNSQSAYLKDPAMLDVLRESQNRMRSISLIHQKLYQGDDLAGIDMFGYTHELAEHLQYSLKTDAKIEFVLEIAKVTMDVSQAVPLGLILNEAITNAIKYAFQGMPNGRIRIELRVLEDQQMMLIIEDNGRGLPEGIDHDKLNSLGMKLMKGLSRQIGAKLELRNENGLSVILTGKISRVLSDAGTMSPAKRAVLGG